MSTPTNEQPVDVLNLSEGIPPEILARFKPAENLYVTEKGTKIRFRDISAGVLDRAQTVFEEQFEEPEPPIQILDHGKGRTSERRDMEDPWYKKKYLEWQGKVSRKLSEWVFVTGIEIEIPEEIEEDSVYSSIGS